MEKNCGGHFSVCDFVSLLFTNIFIKMRNNFCIFQLFLHKIYSLNVKLNFFFTLLLGFLILVS